MARHPFQYMIPLKFDALRSAKQIEPLMMSDELSEALRQLEVPVGQLDPQARKAALVSVFEGGLLNVDEVRLVKELLSKVTLQKDILPNLPLELVLAVTDHLDEIDILSCLTVSRGWNNAFMSDRVVFNLTDRFFPQLIRKGTKSEATVGDDQCNQGMQLLGALRKRVGLMNRAVLGAPRKFDNTYLWDTESQFKLQDQEYTQFAPPNLPINQKAVYAYGQVAWQRETHTLVIDNLVRRSRKIFSFPGGRLLGPEMKLAALGDKLVVATMDRHLLAWDIETGQFEQKTMPSIGGRCTTFGQRVTIIADTEIYDWQFGGSLLAMTTLNTYTSFLGGSATFPTAHAHPHLANVLYARAVYRSSSLTLCFLVHKFVDRVHVKTFSHDANMSWLQSDVLNSSLTGFIPLTFNLDQKRQLYYLYEFDMYHERFSKRYMPSSAKPYADIFTLTIDDDFVVALGDRHYWVC